MALLTDSRFAGAWWTRDARLAPDEGVIRSTIAVEFLEAWPVGGWPGILFLTDRRLLFTPMIWIILPPVREVPRNDLGEVRVDKARWYQRGSFIGSWLLRLEAGNRRYNFSFFGWTRDRERRLTEKWLEAVSQWQN